jgi:hypothetical protein
LREHDGGKIVLEGKGEFGVLKTRAALWAADKALRTFRKAGTNAIVVRMLPR